MPCLWPCGWWKVRILTTARWRRLQGTNRWIWVTRTYALILSDLYYFYTVNILIISQLTKYLSCYFAENYSIFSIGAALSFVFSLLYCQVLRKLFFPIGPILWRWFKIFLLQQIHINPDKLFSLNTVLRFLIIRNSGHTKWQNQWCRINGLSYIVVIPIYGNAAMRKTSNPSFHFIRFLSIRSDVYPWRRIT